MFKKVLHKKKMLLPFIVLASIFTLSSAVKAADDDINRYYADYIQQRCNFLKQENNAGKRVIIWGIVCTMCRQPHEVVLVQIGGNTTVEPCFVRYDDLNLDDRQPIFEGIYPFPLSPYNT